MMLIKRSEAAASSGHCLCCYFFLSFADGVSSTGPTLVNAPEVESGIHTTSWLHTGGHTLSIVFLVEKCKTIPRPRICETQEHTHRPGSNPHPHHPSLGPLPVAVVAFKGLCTCVFPVVPRELIAPCKTPLTSFP